MSGLPLALEAHRSATGQGRQQPPAPSIGDRAPPPLGRCAVVGSSGALLAEEHGAAIDAHDVVIRLNKAPTMGYERHVGSFTSVRLVNAPQSSAWTAELRRAPPRSAGPRKGEGSVLAGSAPLPTGVTAGEVVLLSSSLSAWTSVAPRLVHVARLNRSFRKRCVAPFFTDTDQRRHQERGARQNNRLTPTFGFEAIVHALHACSSVDAYGFYIPPSELGEAAPHSQQLRPPPGVRGTTPPHRAIAPAPFRYHYWEELATDPSAETPDKPWTYRSHDYGVESARLRHMAERGCLLRLHLPRDALDAAARPQ